MDTLEILKNIVWVSILAYSNRNRIGKFLLKTKAGRITIGIVTMPYFVYVIFRLCKLYNDHPELLAKYNRQKKISDFC